MRKSSLLAGALVVMSLLGTAFAQDPVRMFLPAHAADNLRRSVLEADSGGGIHIASSAMTSEGFYYSYCEPGCTGPEQVSEVFFSASGTSPVLALDLDPQGRPHILVMGHGTLGYAYCDGDCRVNEGWNYGLLSTFEPFGDTDREISSNGLAIGPDGRSHFLMHAARRLFDQNHSTWYYSCAANCHLTGNWSGSLIEPEQNYTYADLEVRADGVLMVGLVAEANYDLDMEESLGAYMECYGDCGRGDSWLTLGLADAYDGYWLDVPPAISLELTADGKPRMTMLSMNGNGDAVLMWMHCDAEN